MATNSQAASGANPASGATGTTNPVTTPPDPAAEAARILKEAQAEYDESLLIEAVLDDAERKLKRQRDLRNLLKAMNETE